MNKIIEKVEDFTQIRCFEKMLEITSKWFKDRKVEIMNATLHFSGHQRCPNCKMEHQTPQIRYANGKYVIRCPYYNLSVTDSTVMNWCSTFSFAIKGPAPFIFYFLDIDFENIRGEPIWHKHDPFFIHVVVRVEKWFYRKPCIQCGISPSYYRPYSDIGFCLCKNCWVRVMNYLVVRNIGYCSEGFGVYAFSWNFQDIDEFIRLNMKPNGILEVECFVSEHVIQVWSDEGKTFFRSDGLCFML